MEYVDLKDNINLERLRKPAKMIKEGKIVIFPTETVYGIGTNGFKSGSIKKIYELKKRDFNKPISLLVNSIDMIQTVAKDMPDSLIAKTIIDYSGVPIATPSANISGKPSGTSVDNIMKDFKDSVDCIIDNGESKLGIASTIVKVENEKPIILREGSIKKEEIFDFVNNYNKRKD